MSGSDSLSEGRTSGDITAVVIGRNEGDRLERCLASVRESAKSHPLSSVVYVDSGSSDGSPRRARAAGAEVIELASGPTTAAMGRNAGWRSAQTEFILFLDGDTLLRPGFVEKALLVMEGDSQVAAVWGHRREIHPEVSLFNRVLDLDWIYPPGETEFCGGDVLMRRSALAEVDGYDATLIAGEEPELCRRLRARGWRILHIDAPMTGHDLDMRYLRQYWKRALRAGYAYAEVSRRFEGTIDPFWGAERRSNLFRGGFWSLSLLAAVVTGGVLRAWWPTGLWAAFLMGMALRSARHAQWKLSSASTLFWYGLHSHLQQVPILMGQVQFALNRRRGRQQQLIDYKKAL